MSGDDEAELQEDLLVQQAAFFESYFKKGAEFTRELMAETQRLRARLEEVEERLCDQDRARELEERFEQIERENNDLAALFVAQSQLHSSLDTAEVLQIISEILLNFVGADRFALLLVDGQNTLQPIVSIGVESAELPANLDQHALVAEVLRSGGYGGTETGQRDLSQEPMSAIALGSNKGSFGVVCIWGYLKQKRQVSELDGQIFDLISRSGGLALQASRLVGEARARTQAGPSDGPFERFNRLIRE